MTADELPDGVVGLIEEVRERGCGAWMGRAGCNEPAEVAVVGETQLFFSTFRAVTLEPGVNLVWLCSRHTPDGEDGGAIVRDMPRALRRSQERERQKYLRLLGLAP